MSSNTSHSSSPTADLSRAYAEALHYLCRPVSKATYPGDLTPLRTLLARLDHPERQFKSVIVTGSVGKGTVSCLLAAALREAGLRTGLFSGPHLYNFRERMAIDGQPIGVAALLEQVERIKPLVTDDLGRLSTFELATALALDWFAGQDVEMTVLEVGIGGRFDAVNLAPSGSAIITPIELEHTTLLGNSLADIAYHKAGVIHDDAFTVVAPQPAEAFEVITQSCRQRKATCMDLSQAATWQMTPGHNTYKVSVGDVTLEGQTPLLGRHNALNIATVLAWTLEAARRGYPIRPEHVSTAARHLHMTGRVEPVQRGDTLLLIDGAHTPGGAAALADTLDSLPPREPRTYLVALSRDKDARGFLRALRIPDSACLILTTYKGHRAMPLPALAELAAEAGLHARALPDYNFALHEALTHNGGAGLVVVTGSLFMAAQTREMLGLLSDEALAEARLTRSIFTGAEYLALVDSDPSDEIARLPST